MKKRPWPIVILAVLHILAAPGNLIFNAYIAHLPLSQKWAEYMQPNYRPIAFFYFAIPIIAGLSIYICKRWSFWVYVATIALTCASSWYGYHSRGGAVSLGLLIGVLLLDLIIVFYFFLPAVRAVYFDPRLRWWETNPRYRTNINARWKSPTGEYNGEILNFSVGGLFFKSAQTPQDNSEIEVSFDFEEKSYRLTGLAILHSHQKNMGFGMKFHATPKNTKAGAELVKKFDAAGGMITDRLPGKEDNFFSWAKRLVTTGKGLVPEIKNRK
jgi:hypothetical protein